MKLIKAIVRPNKVDDVKDALGRVSLPGMTVTEVRVTPDLKQARIFVSVMGTGAEQASTLAGLTADPTTSQHVVFSARVGDPRKQNARWINHRAFSSGDVLLSHGLSPYYHRGCSVSLPCSEWERVGPLRYCHQSAEPHRRFAAIAATQARGRVSGDPGD